MARLEGRTTIGSGCTIGAFSHIVDSTLADGVLVRDLCVITQSRIAGGVSIGPFAHLRPGTVLEEEVHIGNFVEVKKSRLGRKSKANHLSYLGDAEIGERCNIGAGTITCNYDGVRKHVTTLGDEVFIGSDTQLVAPVTVGRGAYVGAGSTITKDVPEQALALSRAQQRNIEGWVKRRQEKRKREAPPAGGVKVKMRGKA
jgi:bifunctional UDP-N-acetylglucosamine pyrophosphorylase/glucosamine-1-phosphate N-acetyltransferase